MIYVIMKIDVEKLLYLPSLFLSLFFLYNIMSCALADILGMSTLFCSVLFDCMWLCVYFTAMQVSTWKSLEICTCTRM